LDIDIDLRSDFDVQKVFDNVIPASIFRNKELIKHVCGAYFQSIPTDPITGFAAIPYDVAGDIGFFKIDFLHSSAYDYFESREEIELLLEKEPQWELLQIPSVVQILPQVSKHLSILQKLKPRSILELADMLALIRPGKYFLIDKYLENKDYIRKKYLYVSDEDKYTFKKAHALAYAQMIVLQLHLIEMGVISC
jgi:hypothetical protein